MSVTNSVKVAVSNSHIIGFRNIGFNIDSSDTVSVDKLYVADIRPAQEKTIEKQACVAICSYFETDFKCKNIQF